MREHKGRARYTRVEVVIIVLGALLLQQGVNKHGGLREAAKDGSPFAVLPGRNLSGS